MPETGSGAGALLVSWLKQPGARVEADEPICVVQIDDLSAEIISPASGVLAGTHAKPGQQVSVGGSLAEILPEPSGVDAAPADPLVNLASEIESLEIAVPQVDRQPQSVVAPTHDRPAPGALAAFRSPAVRRLAAENDLDLTEVSGTGRDGRVTRDDVLEELIRTTGG